MPKPSASSPQKRNSSSSGLGGVVGKISLLRGFVANDAFSETDLAQCLREANYNVELAAERLMTGQFLPSKNKRQKISAFASSKSAAPKTPADNTVKASSKPPPQAPSQPPPVVTPKTPHLKHQQQQQQQQRARPSVASSMIQQTPTPRHAVRKRLVTPPEGSWLLCHRWVSDGVCLQRNGSLGYQEVLEVEALPGRLVPTMRFRGSRMLGQFPKHLHAILGPLLLQEDKNNLIQVQAQALMEDRMVPVGTDVAFAIWVYLPDPARFFDLLHPQAMDPSLKMSAKAFFANKNTKSSATSSLQQAAFGLLQWAQNGETFDFMSKIEEGDAKDYDDDEQEVIVDDTEDYDPKAEEENAVEKNDGLETRHAIMDGMDAPPNFKVTLRPYQRQALWWMTQREAQEELEESSKEQLELLEDLVQNVAKQSSPSHVPAAFRGAIHCECGPVQVDLTRVTAPAVNDLCANPDIKHPLWERRYLSNPSKTKALSFYVQPIFGAAMASPPEPPRACRGGFLGDSMGLGKTIMMLALIQSSLQNEEEGSTGPTLIVSPLSLLIQWQGEIESKTSLSYRTYYGDGKQGGDFNANVVLTTYGSLQSEWLAFSKAPPSTQHNGLLTQNWKRVILDEAHCIKNTSTVASKACCMLRAERRWCVSGTIIQNSLDDVYALLKFLRHEPWCQHSFWKAAISSKLRDTCDNPQAKQEALDRVRRLLGPIMLRRTKASLDENGKPILTLPPVETRDIAVHFSPAEREFYDALQRKSLSLFQGFIRNGAATKSWLAIFSLLHRLRQTCDHVALTVKSHLDEDEWARQITQGQDTPKKEFSGNKDTIDQKFLNELMGKFRSMQASGKNEKKSEGVPYAANVANMLNEAVENKSGILKEECSICLDPISLHDSVITPCFHIFCKDCLVGVLRPPREKEHHNPASQSSSVALRLPAGPCPVCNEIIDTSKILRLSNSCGHISTSYLLTSMVQPTLVGTREDDGAARQTLETAVQGSSSSKLVAILQELENVWEEEPGSKVLIFSQFLGFLDLMEESFKKNQITFARLDGKLSLKERMGVLKSFGDDQSDGKQGGVGTTNKKIGSVLLISMKAGGVGLNLVAANTVFIADRWWNAAVEDQCVDRIHRIGQTAKKVRIRKFYVANSVEERIVELQRRKKNVANEVLCDKGAVDADSPNDARPTLDDFKILFQE